MSMTKKEQRLRRSRQTRARIALQRVARLAVHRSNLHIYASIVSDDGTQVLASASTAEKEVREQLGGDGKGQDFSPLAATVRQFARAVVLIGRDAALIRKALAGTGVSLLDAPSMEQAVAMANAQAQAGDAVLMSPACASFDMFRDYAHRAQVFCDAVAELALTQSTVLEGAA